VNIERRDRDVACDDGTQFRVPTDITVLAILGGGNAPCHGDSFEPDGWVYRDGVKQRKWFLPMGSMKRLWQPRLTDIAGIEATRWRCKARYESVWARIEALADEMAAAGIMAADHRYEGRVRRYEITRVADPRGGPARSCWGLGWDDAPSADLLHPESGERVHRLYSYLTDCGGRWGKATRMLERAIENHAFAHIEVDALRGGRPIRLTINGRDYFHAARTNRYGGVEITKLSWPDDHEHHFVFGTP
jgi:hypothetical protein